MEKLRLIYFDGCPNTPRLRQFLDENHIPYEEVLQDDLSEGDPLLAYSSPALLRGSELLYGTRLAPGVSSCTMEPLNTIELLQRLKKSA